MKKIALSLLVLAGLFSSCGKKAEEAKTGTVDLEALKGSTLNILAWEGYADASFTKEFEEKYGVTVKGTYFGSSDELVSKLQSGGGASYDVITPSSDVAGYIVSSGLVEAIETDQIKAWDSLSPTLLAMKDVQKDGKFYGMPFTWGPDYLIYNADVIKETPTSWSLFNDPKYKGKIALYDDISSIYLVAQMLGFDKTDPNALYNMSENQLLACKAKLVEMKPQIRKFWASAGELDNLFKNKEIVAAVGWPLTPANLNKQGMNIKAVIPKEGATGWIDRLMIVKDAKNKQLAQLWLDYVSQPKVMAQVAEFTQYYVANPAANALLSPETQKLMDVASMDAMFKTLNFWQPVKERKRYNEIWNEVKNQ
ncbi:ABC transporter substrate-binding protein [Flavobacterium sp. N3904]|uniref:ABC transporter substrate-binding protein n=1 Tax=Flavobacterium sp. N3904 TaxID=2986835 RepID=UPI0022252428|nr:ABC transporter substrate-binding protein [Flavobacterium sp. N3904]